MLDRTHIPLIAISPTLHDVIFFFFFFFFFWSYSIHQRQKETWTVKHRAHKQVQLTTACNRRQRRQLQPLTILQGGRG